LVVLIGAPLIVYRSAGRSAYADAIEALGRGDCKGAVPDLSRVIGAYRFAPGVPVADAREAIDECRVISDGDAKARRGDLRGRPVRVPRPGREASAIRARPLCAKAMG
jgi:hypothetical protein